MLEYRHPTRLNCNKLFSYFFLFLLSSCCVCRPCEGRPRTSMSVADKFCSVEGRKRAQQKKEKRETLPVNKLSPCFWGWVGWRKWGERENEEDKPLDNNTNRAKGSRRRIRRDVCCCCSSTHRQIERREKKERGTHRICMYVYLEREEETKKEKKSTPADRQEMVDALSMRRYSPYPM